MLKSNYMIFVCCYDAFDVDRIMTLEEEMIIRYDSGLQKDERKDRRKAQR